MSIKKLAVLSHDLPPSASGQAIVLFNLFEDWDLGNYCLISNRPQEKNAKNATASSGSMTLSTSFFLIPPGKRLPIPKPRLLSLSITLLNLLVDVFYRARHIKQILKKEECTAIVVCSGDLVNIPAGYFASRLAKIDFYSYLFDDYQYKRPTKFQRFFAGYMEKIALRKTKGIIVPNEFLAKAYQQRHQIKSILIRNPTPATPSPEAEEVFGQAGYVRIGYTGSLYHAHYDAFQNLINALDGLDRDKYQLHIYTPQSPDDLKSKGLIGPVFIHPPISHAESLKVQRSFDILFLPLAFQSDIPDIIKTSSPGKFGEYLSSGTPILVHAPPDSFLSWYCKKYSCGLVVDRLNPEDMREAINTICNNQALRKKIIANAADRARNDFDLTKTRMRFKEIFFSNV